MPARQTLTILIPLAVTFVLGGDSQPRIHSGNGVDCRGTECGQLQQGPKRRLVVSPQASYALCRDKDTNMPIVGYGGDYRVCRRDGAAHLTSDNVIDDDTAWSRLRAPYGARHRER